jgi:hypothetical protein
MAIHIFPDGLDGTILVPVLLGVLVMGLLTEWWGWDFVGLVVPGYLASVLILQPWVAAVVLAEAVITYGLVKLLDAAATRSGLSFPVFGRDRFFLVLGASIAVRILLEGWGLQWLADVAQARWPTVAAHRAELFGIGVVLVPLTANRLWRSGVGAGLFQLGVQTGLVSLLVILLAGTTNFSIAGFDLAYDHLALSFVSSPRDQILLVVTAALASLLNRRYGWDFHGILVPALLALALHNPWKLIATVLEAVLVVLLASQLLRWPRLRAVSVEGPRKLVLCFLVGFSLKVLIAALVSRRYPGFRANDFFGLGYILPSMLAERIWQKGNLPLVLLPTVQTSLAGLAAGAAIILALTQIAPPVEAASDADVERYASLSQAIAALRPVAERAGTAELTRAVERARREAFRARSDDGYGLAFDDARPGIVALPPATPGAGGRPAVMACDPAHAEAAAPVAAARGWALVVGTEPAASDAAGRLGAVKPCEGAPPRREARSARLTTAARPTLLEPLAPTAARTLPPTPAPARAIAEAARRIHVARGDAPALADALAPLGLTVRTTADGLLVLHGPGWPQVLLRPGAAAVVASPHGREIDAPAAALFAAEELRADCVLPGAGVDGEAALLAVALAEPLRRPLLLVRGTEQLTGDAVLLLQPEQEGIPAWLEPLHAVLAARLELVRRLPDALGALRALPPRAGQAGPAALLWLSSPARRALAGGAADLDRPDLLALASGRGLPVLRRDVAEWISRGAGAPAPELTTMAERLARTRDVALLWPPAHGRLAVLIDEARGVAGLAVESSGRRAVALCGERRRGSFVLGPAAGPEHVARAIASGARVLLSGRGSR